MFDQHAFDNDSTILRQKIWPLFPFWISVLRVRFRKIGNNMAELDSYADNENFLNGDTYLVIIATTSGALEFPLPRSNRIRNKRSSLANSSMSYHLR